MPRRARQKDSCSRSTRECALCPILAQVQTQLDEWVMDQVTHIEENKCATCPPASAPLDIKPAMEMHAISPCMACPCCPCQQPDSTHRFFNSVRTVICK